MYRKKNKQANEKFHTPLLTIYNYCVKLITILRYTYTSECVNLCEKTIESLLKK